MKTCNIRIAFSTRSPISIPKTNSEFEELACSLSKMRASDQLNILPSLMMALIENVDFRRSGNYADMVIYVLMPQPDGWPNIIDEMNDAEAKCVLQWLTDVQEYEFSTLCEIELRSATDLFRSRMNPRINQQQ